MIVPQAHLGRDGLVATALVAQAVTARGGSLRALADALPRLHMVKAKLALPAQPWTRLAARLRKRFDGLRVQTSDGLRFSRGDEWLHVRPSGTEPVVRVIAETPSASRTRELIRGAREALAGPRRARGR
jgi:phosphomannomutase